MRMLGRNIRRFKRERGKFRGIWGNGGRKGFRLVRNKLGRGGLIGILGRKFVGLINRSRGRSRWMRRSG